MKVQFLLDRGLQSRKIVDDVQSQISPDNLIVLQNSRLAVEAYKLPQESCSSAEVVSLKRGNAMPDQLKLQMLNPSQQEDAHRKMALSPMEYSATD